jgi:RND family efflux transporter MFP subunit
MNRNRLLSLTVLAALAVAGGTGYHRYERDQELRRQRAVKDAGIVSVTVASVESRDFRGQVPFTGTLLAVNRAELKAEVSGRVTRVTVQEGDRVAAGAVLCAQDEDELLLAVQSAQAQLAQVQVQAQQARSDNERFQALLAKHSVTRQAAQQAETAYNANMAAVAAAESNLGLARTRLKKARTSAPFSGEVARRAVQPGEMLSPGQTAFEVVDNRKLEILADLPAEALSKVKVGMRVSFRAAGFEQPFAGALTQISPSVQQDGRTLRVRLEVPNADGRLKGGLFAEGTILTDGTTALPALPARVLTAKVGSADLFVVENGLAKARRVQVGAEQDGWRPVEGLEPGTQVVDQGRELVAEGTALKVVAPQVAAGRGI